MFYEGTMEHTAVQLMSRKQRAAKILTGDTGLTGLDALTEGEGGFEQALLNAITSDDALIDPRDLFKQDHDDDEITEADNAFWNVDVSDDADGVTDDTGFATFTPDEDEDETVAPVTPQIVTVEHNPIVPATATPTRRKLAALVVSDDELETILASMDEPVAESSEIQDDPLVKFAVEELGAVVSTKAIAPKPPASNPKLHRQSQYVWQYIESVSYAPKDRLRKHIPKILFLISDGEWDPVEEVKKVPGIQEQEYLNSEPMQNRLHRRVTSYLKNKRLVEHDRASDAARRIIEMSLMAYDLIPLSINIFGEVGTVVSDDSSDKPRGKAKPKKKTAKRSRKKKTDLLAFPDDDNQQQKSSNTPKGEGKHKQLEMFSFA